MKAKILLALSLVPIFGQSQPAELELSGVFGEGIRGYSSTVESLSLQKDPDLRSSSVQIQYTVDRLISYVKGGGVTRVLRTGIVNATTPEPLVRCNRVTRDGNSRLVVGEEVQYLYYLGEGIGRVKVRDAECDLDIAKTRVIEIPVVQEWLKVLSTDGTSPGWLLNDGSQTKLLMQ